MGDKGNNEDQKKSINSNENDRLKRLIVMSELIKGLNDEEKEVLNNWMDKVLKKKDG